LSGIVLSPDQSRIYLTDRNQSRVVVYSNHGNSATELFQFSSNGASTIQSPASMLFSQDGTKLYIANLGLSPAPATDQVAQVTPDGLSAGPDLTGGPPKGRSGMAFDPQGRLLVGNFNLLEPGGGNVLRFDTNTNQFENFIGPSDSLTGASGLLVQGNDLYVSALGGSVSKYDVTTGALQTDFGVAGSIPLSMTFNLPGNMIVSADGTTFLVGVPTQSDGLGDIQRFTSDGTLSQFAQSANLADNFPSPAGINGLPAAVAFGFSEATGLVYTTIIPEPASVALMLVGVAAMGTVRRRS
jgi:DNA-binding beta-propeller fold protein YncE